jgi:hypothetical protein
VADAGRNRTTLADASRTRTNGQLPGRSALGRGQY